MKKIFVLFLIVLLSSFAITSCSNSNYDKLSDNNKSIVDNVLSHENMFSDCNGIKFDDYNGKKYFVATYTKYSNNANNDTPFGGAVGYVAETKYFVVDSETFTREEYDVYNGQTAMGFTNEWDSNWDLETKREKLASAINLEY